MGSGSKWGGMSQGIGSFRFIFKERYFLETKIDKKEDDILKNNLVRF